MFRRVSALTRQDDAKNHAALLYLCVHTNARTYTPLAPLSFTWKRLSLSIFTTRPAAKQLPLLRSLAK